MKHFTSYYANFGNIPKDYMCVGISRICPDWFKGNNIPNFMFVRHNVLAPSESILYGHKNGTITEDQYTRQYISDVITKVQTELKQPDIPTWINYVDNFFENESNYKIDYIASILHKHYSPYKLNLFVSSYHLKHNISQSCDSTSDILFLVQYNFY